MIVAVANRKDLPNRKGTREHMTKASWAKRIGIVCGVVCTLALAPTVAMAQGAPTGSTGTPTEYTITLNACAISTDGVTFLDMWTATTPKSLDMGSVAGGSNAKAGDFLTNLSIPSGTYTTVKCTLDQLLNVTGSIVHLATTYFTSTGSATAPTVGPATSLQVDLGADVVFTAAINVTVVAGTPASFQINFDLTGSIGLNDVGGGLFAIVPQAPVVAIS